MRNVYELLKEQEVTIEQLRREIAALRLVIPLLQEEGDSIESSRAEEKPYLIPVARKGRASSAGNHPRIGEAAPDNNKEESAKSVLLHFRQIASGVSRALLKRVRESGLSNREPQRKTVRDVFERLGPTNAA